MSLCERNIDCLECSSRGMCNSYARFKYNQALEDMADKLKSKPYWDDEHNFQAIPIGYIDEVLEEITIK